MRTAAVALSLLVLVAPSATWSQTPAPSDRSRQEAAARVDNGIKLYDKGDYAAALAEFEQAYALSDAWEVLIYIGASQSKLRRYGEAIDTFDRYLQLGGDAVPVEQKQQVSRELAEIRSVVAEVTIRVEGPPAELWVDGRSIGRSPLDKPLVLGPGEHVFRATRPAYQPAEERLTLVAGVKRELDLAPAAVVKQRSTLHVRSTPPGAAISIDGVDKGLAPYKAVVDPGEYVVTAELPGHASARAEVALTPGQTRSITLTLVSLPAPPRPRPWHKRWEVWAGAGAGAIALAVGTYGILYLLQPDYDAKIKAQ